MVVTNWPAYLLRNIPPRTRARLSSIAEDDDTSVADVVRSLLCNHYRLDCPPESWRYEPARDQGGVTLRLYLQPELWWHLKQDTGGRYGELRRHIMEVIHEQLGEP